MAHYRGEKVRFMTLTTSPLTAEGLDKYERLELLQRDFRAFKRRIEREFGNFNYIAVRTLEGYGVIHILYRGSYIPHSWIVDNWNELHGSFIVDIREPRGSAYDGARYVVSQYLSDQRTPKFVYGWSKDWVFSGFVNDWNEIRRRCYDENNIVGSKVKMINEWDKYLQSKTKKKKKIVEVHLEDFLN